MGKYSEAFMKESAMLESKIHDANNLRLKEDGMEDDLVWQVIMKLWATEEEDLRPKTDPDVVKALVHIHCDLFMQFLQTRQHHWLMQGIVFRDIHLMFDEASADLLEMIDDVAERIVATGAIPPTNPATIMAISDIPLIEEDDRDRFQMLNQSIEAIRDIIDDIKELNELADNNKEVGIVNMIGGIAQDLEKLLYKYQQFLSVFG